DPIWRCDRLISRAKVIENQIMAALVILISSDSSDESVGSSPSRIILFGTIPGEIPAETPTIPHVVPTLPHTLQFLYSDSSETPSDSSERPPSQDPYEVTIARWRSKVAARSSPPSSPTHDSPPTVRQIVPAPLGVPRRPAILVLPGQEIHLGRPYCTQPNRVRKMLIARKRVRALPLGRLASRYPPDHYSSNHFSSDDCSSDSSSEYSSDSSSSHSLPDSSFDASTTISAGPSRKRCRSPTALVPLATPKPGALSPIHADLLPPRKRIRGSAIASDYDDSTEGISSASSLSTGPEAREGEGESKPSELNYVKLETALLAIAADTVAAETAAALEVGIGIEREEEVEEEAESG
ncbi:hypothetical protein Tco_1514310, partial [Tanacetum coccineum]